MVHALWDSETNNLVAEFDEIKDALALIRRGIERNGQADTNTLALDVEDVHGEVRLIAHGRQLAVLAHGQLTVTAMPIR